MMFWIEFRIHHKHIKFLLYKVVMSRDKNLYIHFCEATIACTIGRIIFGFILVSGTSQNKMVFLLILPERIK